MTKYGSNNVSLNYAEIQIKVYTKPSLNLEF